MTRRDAVLAKLREHPNEWLPGMALMNAEVGGTRAGGRIHELRKQGHLIEERRDPEHRSAVSQYRLVTHPAAEQVAAQERRPVAAHCPKCGKPLGQLTEAIDPRYRFGRCYKHGMQMAMAE